MYKIENTKNNNNDCIKLINPNSKTYALIVLNQGASLQEFYSNGIPIIKDLYPLTYQDTYASALLFPFANRIKDGQYNFNNQTFQLLKNHEAENNALHGLVYNKTFIVKEEDVAEHYASMTLIYEEQEQSMGFPFTYKIKLKYVLKDDALKLSIKVINTDSKPFPFTLGWHPYFYSSNLYNSYLKFDSTKKIVFDEKMITVGIDDYKVENKFEIKDKQLDDCFVLDNPKVIFNNPNYSFELNTSETKNTFLQVYTPDKKNVIAIEPTTGISNSFNNKIGLQILNPNDAYSIDWEIKVFKNI